MTLDSEGSAPLAPVTGPAVADIADDGVADQVVRGGVIRTVGFGVTNIIALVATIIVTRYLSKDDFGRYGSVMALITIIFGITDGGLNIVGARELSLRDPGDARRLLTGALLGIRMLLTTIGVGLAVAAAFALGFTSTQVVGTAIAGVGSVAIASVSALTMPALVDLQNLRLLYAEIARQVIQLVGNAVCVAAGFGLVAFFGVQAIIGPLVILALPLLIGRGVLLRPRYDPAEWSHMVRVALPIAIAGVLSVLYLKVIVLIGSQSLAPGEQGLLVMTTRAVEILSGLPLIVVGVVLPVVSRAARDDPGRLRYVAQRLLESSMILGIFLSLPLSFGARTVLDILGGSKYEAATSALQIQAWMLLTVFVVQSSVVLLIALHRHRAIIIANLIGLVAVVIAGAILIPARGVVGGGIAVLIADAILMTVTIGFVLRSELRGELSFGAAPRILLAVLLASAAGLATPGPDVAAAAVATLVFAVLLLVLRAAPPEARDLLLRRAR